MQEKAFIVVRGISGAGKSTWARRFRAAYPEGCVRIIEADDFRTREGRYVFDARQSKLIYAACLATAAEAMQSGVPYIILANASTSWRSFAKFVALAHDQGYPVFQKILPVLPQEAVQRTIHRTPLWVIENQHRNLENSLQAERERGAFLPEWDDGWMPQSTSASAPS